MRVAQSGVDAFVGHALRAKVPFAFEMVFSHWQPRPDGSFASKIDRIREMQTAGYFVLLLFVGLASAQLSILRVATRGAEHGHDVPLDQVAAAALSANPTGDRRGAAGRGRLDPDRQPRARGRLHGLPVHLGATEIYELRRGATQAPRAILDWLDIVSPPDA